MTEATSLDRDLARIVIQPSKRGMAELSRELRPDLFTAAAAALLADNRPVVIATGFPISGKPETDGPPGALALTDALTRLGKHVRVASWPELNDDLAALKPEYEFLAVPIDARNAERFSEDACFITVEACGKTVDGTYRNMRHKDISADAPKFEDVFGERAFISIGDGGNEFGMGGMSAQFYDKWQLLPPISVAEHLLPGTTSNFVCYALIKALAVATGTDLLPMPDEHGQAIERMVAMGFVDGVSGSNIPQVDGLPLAETIRILCELRSI